MLYQMYTFENPKPNKTRNVLTLQNCLRAILSNAGHSDPASYRMTLTVETVWSPTENVMLINVPV